MPQRLTDHLNRNTTILSGSSPGMTDSIGSDRRSQPKSLCKSLQTIIEPAESGLIFPICTFIFSLLVAKKYTEQIVGTIRMRRLTVALDGKSKIAVRLDMLGCACVDMPIGYVEQIGERN